MGKFAYIDIIYNHLPEKTYSNEDFYTDFPSEKGKMSYPKLGVKNRHISDHSKTAVDLAIEAGNAFFEKTGIDRNGIDYLLLNTLEDDYLFCPYNCSLVHAGLNLRSSCGTSDMRYGCSAYVYGLSTLSALFQVFGFKRALFITVNNLTKKIHSKDKANRFIFGDAASVTLLSGRDTPSIGQTVFGNDGKGFKKIYVPHGGAREVVNNESVKEITDEFGNTTTLASYHMEGTGVFLFTLRVVPPLVADTLAANQLKKEDIDYFVFHQTNHYLNEVIRNKCEIPEEKFIQYMENTGNTVSSTIPIVLEKMMSDNRLKKGNRVMIAGFGSGLSWAATIITV